MKNLFLLLMVVLTLWSCKSKTGKMKTESGYEYEVFAKGSGDAAKPLDYVSVSLGIVGDDGVALQENYDANNYPILQLPETRDLNNPNPLMDALTGAQIGDSLVITMPMDSFKMAEPTLAHLKNIYYRVAVKDIMSEEAYQNYIAAKKAEKEAKASVVRERLPEIEALVAQTLEDYKANKLDLQVSDSGLKYFIHEEGAGAVTNQGDMANVHYYGVLTNGEMFDNSFARGSEFQFRAGTGSVIKGWDEALTTLKKGTKATLFIPSELGYGASGAGSIPANSELVFYIEVADDTK